MRAVSRRAIAPPSECPTLKLVSKIYMKFDIIGLARVTEVAPKSEIIC
jgi:hypothetical protein